jgi:hypothetical protein
MVKISDKDNFVSNVVFCDEATFHLSGTMNWHNVRIRGLENPHESTQYARHTPKVNVFYALPVNKVVFLEPI